MIIGACGYGATGSSVITDLLREYDDVQVVDNFEFWIAYCVDGLEDLEYHLMKQYSKGESCDAAIRRFLRRSKSYKVPFINKPCAGNKFYEISRCFIEEITQFRFKGAYTADVCTGHVFRDVFAFAFKKIFMPQFIEKILNKRTYLWPCGVKYYSVEPENFYEAAIKYTNAILDAMNMDKSKPICLDQPFTGNSPENSMKFFEDPYAIIVDKDPRDLFLSGKYSRDPNFKFSPISDVDKFIIYYRNMRKHTISSDKVLELRFEDLVYNYDKTLEKIEKFLNLGKHTRVKQIFDPSKSINNTQLIRLHPDERENINKIEEELADFLYPFENYKNIEFNGKPFDGAARKMVEH